RSCVAALLFPPGARKLAAPAPQQVAPLDLLVRDEVRLISQVVDQPREAVPNASETGVGRLIGGEAARPGIPVFAGVQHPVSPDTRLGVVKGDTIFHQPPARHDSR